MYWIFQNLVDSTVYREYHETFGYIISFLHFQKEAMVKHVVLPWNASSLILYVMGAFVLVLLLCTYKEWSVSIVS